MSGDVIRDYTGKYGSLRKHGRRKKRRGRGRGCLVFLLLLGILAGIAYEYWATNDRYPMATFVPRGQRYNVVVDDVLVRKAKLAQSPLWQIAPEHWSLEWLPAWLDDDLAMPGWVRNNLIGRTCILTGNDMQGFSDMVVITHTTRIGAMLNHALWGFPQVASEKIGDFPIHFWEKAGLYFAIRGQTLIACPTRDELLRVLQQHAEGAASAPPEIVTALAESGAEDLRGTVTLDSWPESLVGQAFRAVRFALQLDNERLFLKFRGVLSPEWQDRLASLLQDVSPQHLKTPPAGMAALSANFERPSKDAWMEIASVVKDPEWAQETWNSWATMPSEGPPDLPFMLTTLLGQAGPGMRVSWTGMELDEIVPAFILTGSFELRDAALEDLVAHLPRPPEDLAAWDTWPRYDAEARRAWLPMMGGRDIEPTVLSYGDGVLVSTSANALDQVLLDYPEQGTFERKANLYARIVPRACAEALFSAGAMLVECDLLDGYDAESFAAERAKWMGYAQSVDDATLWASHENGEIVGQFEIVSAN